MPFLARSPYAGPEPSSVTTWLLDGLYYAAVGLIRQGGIMM